jgi:penicillin amidase
MLRLLTRTAMVLAALIVVAAIAGYWYVRQSLPAFNGQLRVSGITAAIDIVRDSDAIPHIFASSKNDAMFGLGYVHAQDRLWQMELQRRIGHGRLSEIFGAVTIPQDRFLRTVGFGRAARAAWDRMPAPWKDQVGAYVAGINAFIAGHHGRQLPPEFSVFRFEPQPWTGPDVVVWQKMLAWDLSANYAMELLRDDLVRAVGVDRMHQLMPPYAESGLSILGPTAIARLSPRIHAEDRNSQPVSSSRPPASSLESLTAALAQGIPAVRDVLLGSAATEAVGSNNWVVDGTLSATGRPLLANDPHLGTRIPSTWYLAHMSAGDFDVAGATLPGTPAVALGRNRDIAWGATNALVDVEDLYRERIDGSGHLAEFRGAEEPISVIPETIDVHGAPAVTIDVRVTRHGPLVSDAINANNAVSRGVGTPALLEPLAFRWTALDADDTTLAAFLQLNEARDWAGFTDALARFVVPSQNFVYADTAGHIGYYTPGRVPIRAGGDGSRPVEGWTGANEWTGWMAFADLPHVFDPPAHFIVTANNRQEPAGYAFNLGVDWQEPLRATRITELLRAGTRFTPDDFARIQADTVSVQSRTLLPLFLSQVQATRDTDREAIAALRGWSGDARGDSAAAAIFSAWLQHLVPAIAGDELGSVLVKNYQERFSSVTRFLVHTLAADDARWCDDTRTTLAERCSDILTQSLHEALDDMTARLGGDMKTWRWDRVHGAVFPHQGLDSVALLRPLLSRSAPTGGDWSSVNVGTPSVTQPYEQRNVAGFRMIADLSAVGDNRFIIDLGESGHPLSAHYDDFLKDWQAVHHRKMRMDRAEIERGALGHLRLAPVE